MNYQRRLLTLGLLDSFIITIALILAYLLRFDFHIPLQFRDNLPYVIATSVILNLLAFSWVKIYRRVWQYASIGELVSLVKATTVYEIAFYLLNTIVKSEFQELIIPRSIYGLSWALIIIGIGGARFGWRMFRDSYLKIQPHHRRTLIIGAGKAGVLIAKELKHSSNSDLYPVAFIDDDSQKWMLEVVGLPVLGGREQIPHVVAEYQIEKIVIAVPSSDKNEVAKIIEICKNTKAQIHILPRVSDLISTDISVNMIREVRVEDLLGREPVQVDLEGIANYVTNKVVLVTGAGGSIGSELCRQISPFNPKRLLLLGHGENSIYDIELELRKSFPDLNLETLIADIQDFDLIREIFNKFKPEVVFHAAAHKHVPLMERNPAEAVKNNVLGTKNIVDCAHEFGAERFVMISTDKAVNPTSIMGTSKRIAEMYVQGFAKFSQTKFVAVRFGNVLGSRGSVIPVFKRQIQEGGPVTVTHPEMVRYFMTIPEAVQLVIQAGALAKGGEVFILDMGKPVKISDLARDLIKLSGFEPDVDIKIVYSGIRPGEKLYEEILTSEEGISATKHNRIFVGRPIEYSWDEYKFMIGKLEQIATKKDALNRSNEIRELFKQIVPTFQGGTPEKVETREKVTAIEKETAMKEVKAGESEIAVSK